MRFLPSELLLAPSPPAFRLRWPVWCLRLALDWTDRCIANLQTQLAAEFAVDGLAPLHAELDALTQERMVLLRHLTAHGRR